MGWTDIIPGVGMLKTIMIVATVTSLVSAGVGTERYFAGKRAGVAKDKDRSDAVITKMVATHAEAALNAEREHRALFDRMQTKVQEAQSAQAIDRKKNQVVVAAVAADRDQLRDQLNSAVGRSIVAAATSTDAGDSGAKVIGGVLADLLRSLAQCAGEAEDIASGLRTLRNAWPVSD